MSDQLDNRSVTAVPASLASELRGGVTARVSHDGTSLSALREWVQNHDERWLFIVLYVGLAVVLSIWISLFWLLAVVAAHFALELARQRQLHGESGRRVVLEALWELKLDVALILFALALTLYMSVVLGIVGLQSAARIGAASRAAARFGAWERTLRGILLSADDAAQVARAVAMRRRAAGKDATPAEAAEARAALAAEEAAAEAEAETGDPRWGSWVGRWGTGDRIAGGLAIACVALILLAPWLTDHTFETAFATMLTEMRPLP